MLQDILILVVGLLLGAVIGFFITKKLVAKQLKENPPINEQMIEALMAQMGRKPNKKQVRQMMNTMEKYR
ncbi:MAG: YneF family protein [Bacilli bacterium]|nr:YneF family protein [Bacilli bacterium]